MINTNLIIRTVRNAYFFRLLPPSTALNLHSVENNVVFPVTRCRCRDRDREFSASSRQEIPVYSAE